MLFHTLAAPGTGVYVEQFVCELRGALRADLFRRAWMQTIDRHAALRTVFVWQDVDAPLQVVRTHVDPEWQAEDFRSVDAVTAEAHIEEYLKRDRSRGFDPSRAPLLRFRLFVLDDASHRFVWTFHHLLLDGWSTPLVFGDVLELYSALVSGAAFRPVERRSFRDYIAWLRHHAAPNDSAYWISRLQGFHRRTMLGILADSRGEATPTARIERELDASLTDRLKVTARNHRWTLNTVIQGAWAIIAGRYSGETDIVHGVTVSGRPSSLQGVEHMVGSFINTLPLRTRIDRGSRLSDWLAGVQESIVELQERGHTPLGTVQSASELGPGESLFDSIVVFENIPPRRSARDHGGIEIVDETYIGQSNYPLALIFVPGEKLRLIVIYDPERIADAAAERIPGHFETVLRAVADTPNVRTGDVPVMTDAELQDSDMFSHAGEDASAWSIPVYQLIDESARISPDSPALRSVDRVMTYRELRALSDRISADLSGRTEMGDEFVGVLAERSIETIAAMLGVLKSGLGYVPLDPDIPEERLADIVADAGIRRIIVPESDALRFELPGVETLQIGPDTYPSFSTPIPAGSAATAGTMAGSIAYVMYTSGSTGRPKGVCIDHTRLAYSTWARSAYYDRAPERYLLLSPLSFDSSVAGIYWTLASGGELILAEPGTEKDPARILEVLHSGEVTHTLCIPSLYEAVLRRPDVSLPKSLKSVIVAGENCPPSVRDRHFDVTDGVRLYNEYGPTEATVWSTVHEVRADDSSGIVPIGRPIPGSMAVVLDRNLERVPIGIAGELCIGGPGVSRGYLNMEEETSNKFVTVGLADGSTKRVYRTGDRVRRTDEGVLEFLGRIDNQIKIRGHRIEPEEIEKALEKHDLIAEAVAAVKQVGDREMLVAYVVPTREGADPEYIEHGLALGEVRQFLERRLPRHMIPDYVVPMGAIPRTVRGKLDRESLPAPDPRRSQGVDAHTAPQTPLGIQICIIWEDVLGVSPVGMDDDFFDLGGDSLLAITLAMRLERALNIDVPVSALVEHSTPGGLLSLALAENGRAVTSSPVAIRGGGSMTPLFCVPGAGGYPVLFHRLAARLGKKQPVHAFVPKGVDGWSIAHDSVTVMARSYIEEMRRVQPDGPFLICGHSVGGLIALEMANQLAREGDRPDLVILLDTFMGSAEPQSFRERLRDVYVGLRTWLQIRTWSRQALEFLARGERIPREIRNSLPARLHERACRAYTVPRYDGNVLLFSSISDAARINRERWKKAVSGRLDIIEISESHRILDEPHVREVAEHLRRALDAGPALESGAAQ